MTKKQDSYDELEQYVYSSGELLEKVLSKYCPLIGLFLVNFSVLEQDLNIAIADFIYDDNHEVGFVIIEKLSMLNKIELFYKMYVRLEYFKKKKNKETLNKIKTQLETLNTFRNNIVHADWQSLTKEGLVRTKIMVDNQEGYVKFKKIKITPRIINQKIQETDKLIELIEEYKETAFEF
ncbi:MAG: hypothetical protein WBD86_02170 [Microgenomates group bacterium]